MSSSTIIVISIIICCSFAILSGIGAFFYIKQQDIEQVDEQMVQQVVKEDVNKLPVINSAGSLITPRPTPPPTPASVPTPTPAPKKVTKPGGVVIKECIANTEWRKQVTSPGKKIERTCSDGKIITATCGADGKYFTASYFTITID